MRLISNYWSSIGTIFFTLYYMEKLLNYISVARALLILPINTLLTYEEKEGALDERKF